MNKIHLKTHPYTSKITHEKAKFCVGNTFPYLNGYLRNLVVTPDSCKIISKYNINLKLLRDMESVHNVK